MSTLHLLFTGSVAFGAIWLTRIPRVSRPKEMPHTPCQQNESGHDRYQLKHSQDDPVCNSPHGGQFTGGKDENDRDNASTTDRHADQT